jgi:hypothetical protein
VFGEVSALTGCRDPAIREGVAPRLLAGGDRDPGRGIQLHNVRRSAAGVPWARYRLNGSVGRNAHFNRVSLCGFGENL